MKKIIFLLISVSLFIQLFSCGKAEKSYRNDLSAPELARAAAAKLPKHEEYISYSNEDILLMLGDDLAKTEGAVFATTNPISIDEFGIFRCTLDTSDTLDDVKDYLFDTIEGKTEWLRSYNPDEVSKLVGGKVKIFGDYIVYSFLDDNSRNILYGEIEKLLSK